MSTDGFVSQGDCLHIQLEKELIFVRIVGMMTLKDAHILLKLYRTIRQEYGIVLVMFDCARSEGIHREARVAMADLQPSSAADATAIFGASFTLRTVGNMIERAIVGLGKPSLGLRFFATEAEARAFLSQERERVLARSPSTS
jgi:SpoIIAA-like